MELLLKEVIRPEEMEAFIRFPDKLYKGNPYYIPALHRSEKNTLSREHNPAFGHCNARYWLVYQEQKVAGRIAGIINHRYNQEQEGRYMRFGWMDFIEDHKVLELLLQALENWAREENMQYIHGPLGFTSFDPSGVLVEGFEELPTAWGRYNYSYYDPMLETAGYTKDKDWIEMAIKVPEETNQREIKVAQMVKKRYSLKHAPLKTRIDIRQYSGEVFDMVNSVYKGLYCFSTLSREQIEKLTESFVKILQPDFVSVVLNEKDEAVAFGVVVPSLSKALKKAGGKLYPFGFLHIKRALHFNDTADMLLVGVKPEYQRKGAYALVFEKIITSLQARKYKLVETTRELEENERVQQLWEGYEKRQHKRARCYIKSLDY